MAITLLQRGRSREDVILTECPFCDHSFDKHEKRPKHYLEDHTPTDAGLSPLGDSRPADDSGLGSEAPVESHDRNTNPRFDTGGSVSETTQLSHLQE